LQTGKSSWAESDPDSEQLRFDAQKDRQGPLVIGVAIQGLQPDSKLPQTPEAESTKDKTSPSPSPTANSANEEQNATPSPEPSLPSPTSKPSATQSKPKPQARRDRRL
jgi:hypothetical protein